MRIIAHRGHSARHPENSVSAWRGAVVAGADMVEIDVRFTADGRAICCHDPDLARLADDPRAVAELSHDDLDELHRAHPGLLPDLESAFAEIPTATGILLDVKDESPRALDLLAAALNCATRPGCILGLHSLEAVRRMSGVAEILALVPRAAKSADFVAAGAGLFRLWEIDVPEHTFLADGVPFWVTAGGIGTGRIVGDIDSAGLRWLAAYGANGVLLNDPQAARTALALSTSDPK